MSCMVEFLSDEVRAEFSAFPHDTRASFEHIVDLIQAHGLERLREFEFALRRAKEVR